MAADIEQGLVQHLIELRARLIRALLCVLLIFIALSFFANDLYSYAARPLIENLSAGNNMIATQVASTFLVPLKLAFFIALVISMPYLLYQVWAFIAPGLYENEKKLAIPLLISSILLFYTGFAFAYFLIFPIMFAFFTHAAPQGVHVMTDISHYLDFIMKLLFAFGLAFEVPVLTFMLTRTGIISIESLQSKRPYIIVAAFTLGMLLTPPDVLSQVLLAVPLCLLFEVGLLMSKKLGVQATATQEQEKSGQ